jgi:hypothetical protein
MALVPSLPTIGAADLGVGLLFRAVGRLPQSPETPPDELVPVWERHATTLVGLPLLVLGLSSITPGPLAVPGYGGVALFLGIVVLPCPNYTPASVG